MHRHLYDYELMNFLDVQRGLLNKAVSRSEKISAKLADTDVASKPWEASKRAEELQKSSEEAHAIQSTLDRHEDVLRNAPTSRPEDYVAQRWFEMVALDAVNMISPSGESCTYAHYLGRIVNRYANHRSAAHRRDAEIEAAKISAQSDAARIETEILNQIKPNP